MAGKISWLFTHSSSSSVLKRLSLNSSFFVPFSEPLPRSLDSMSSSALALGFNGSWKGNKLVSAKTVPHQNAKLGYGKNKQESVELGPVWAKCHQLLTKAFHIIKELRKRKSGHTAHSLQATVAQSSLLSSYCRWQGWFVDWIQIPPNFCTSPNIWIKPMFNPWVAFTLGSITGCILKESRPWNPSISWNFIEIHPAMANNPLGFC